MQQLNLAKVKLQGLIHKLPMLANLDRVDVLITSYPRSGLSWFRCLLAGYIYGDDVWLGNVQDYIPSLGDDLWKPKKIKFKIIGSHSEARIIKKLKPETKIIFIFRDEGSTDSYYRAFQVRYNVKITKEFFKKWVYKDYAYPLPRDRFLNEWKFNYGLCLVYPFSVLDIKKALEYIGYDVDDDRLEKVYNKFTKDKMREMQNIINPKNLAVSYA